MHLDRNNNTFLNLAVIYFGHIGMLYIFELVHQSQIFIHFGFVIDVVSFVIHEVFVGGIDHMVDIYFSEEGVFAAVDWLYFVCYVCVGS